MLTGGPSDGRQVCFLWIDIDSFFLSIRHTAGLRFS